MNRLLTVADAAERLGVSPDLIYILVSKRLISCVRVGSGKARPRLRIEEEAIERYIETHRVIATDEPAPAPAPAEKAIRFGRRRSLSHLLEAGRYV